MGIVTDILDFSAALYTNNRYVSILSIPKKVFFFFFFEILIFLFKGNEWFVLVGAVACGLS